MALISSEEIDFIAAIMAPNVHNERHGTLLYSESLFLFYASGCISLSDKSKHQLSLLANTSRIAAKILSAPDCEVVHTSNVYTSAAKARLGALQLASQIKKGERVSVL